MSGHGAKFGRKKEDAIAALLTTRTPEEAARAVNVSPKTLLRWQKEPEFDLAFRAAKRAAFGQAIGRLHHLSSAAVTTLGKVMLDYFIEVPAALERRALARPQNKAQKPYRF